MHLCIVLNYAFAYYQHIEANTASPVLNNLSRRSQPST